MIKTIEQNHSRYRNSLDIFIELITWALCNESIYFHKNRTEALKKKLEENKVKLNKEKLEMKRYKKNYELLSKSFSILEATNSNLKEKIKEMGKFDGRNSHFHKKYNFYRVVFFKINHSFSDRKWNFLTENGVFWPIIERSDQKLSVLTENGAFRLEM